MKHSKAISALLVLSGLVGIYVGVGLLFFPVELQAQSNIIMGDNPSQFSETRAPGSAIFFASIIILTGAFRKSWTYFSLIISALFFLSYGLGRLLSLALDGMPAGGLFVAMIGELILGFLTLFALLKYRTSSNSPSI